MRLTLPREVSMWHSFCKFWIDWYPLFIIMAVFGLFVFILNLFGVWGFIHRFPKEHTMIFVIIVVALLIASTMHDGPGDDSCSPP